MVVGILNMAVVVTEAEVAMGTVPTRLLKAAPLCIHMVRAITHRQDLGVLLVILKAPTAWTLMAPGLEVLRLWIILLCIPVKDLTITLMEGPLHLRLMEVMEAPLGDILRNRMEVQVDMGNTLQVVLLKTKAVINAGHKVSLSTNHFFVL